MTTQRFTHKNEIPVNECVASAIRRNDQGFLSHLTMFVQHAFLWQSGTAKSSVAVRAATSKQMGEDEQPEFVVSVALIQASARGIIACMKANGDNPALIPDVVEVGARPQFSQMEFDVARTFARNGLAEAYRVLFSQTQEPQSAVLEMEEQSGIVVTKKPKRRAKAKQPTTAPDVAMTA